MTEAKAVVGLSWEPNIPNFSAKTGLKVDAKPQETNHRWKPASQLVDGLFVPPNNPKTLNKLQRKQLKDTTGSNWFDMPAPTMTPELQKDLKLLKLRSVMDPKRHYKKGDSQTAKYFQVGTVVESASDFFSGRLTKKERKATVAEELLSDPVLATYRKRKVREIEEKNRPADNEKWKNKGKTSYKRAKQRRH
ncbi:PREDICTED: rRNA-processing protein fcf2-like [Fragaria vesca subsp. vesca]|uniref:rRNA-processing protein fcf2-like n=1 Tax=Fragaria vesca subsp. vesca TaxID=101020 RepID=UPI0002C3187E|nr:PREDICTED: rRNA-processing protein fcf2-like [Fragaria vesca subsp. vesca]